MTYRATITENLEIVSTLKTMDQKRLVGTNIGVIPCKSCRRRSEFPKTLRSRHVEEHKSYPNL
jgi:hypothetical protein